MDYQDVIELNNFKRYNGKKVYRIVRSKKDDSKLISHTDEGKIILISNQSEIHAGYGIIKNMNEKKTCIVAKMENIIYDYYSVTNYNHMEDKIPLDELCKVFENKGFTFQYEESIKANGEEPIKDKMRVYANLKTGALVVIQTYDDGRAYNSIDLYITVKNNKPSFEDYKRSLGLYVSGCGIESYDLCFTNRDFPINNILSKSINSTDWHGETPQLWTYADKERLNSTEDFKKVLKKIYRFKDPIDELFNMDIENHYKEFK